MRLSLNIGLLITTTILSMSMYSQTIESKLELKKGNEFFLKGDFEKSSKSYNNSLNADDNNLNSIFNSGNSSLMKGEYEEAREYFKTYISKSSDKLDKSLAHYNLGNSFLKQHQKEVNEGGQNSVEHLQNAVNEYKQSLRHNPKDSDARYNLSYAMKMMQNQQNKDKDQKDKDQKDKDQKDKDQKDKDQKDKDQKEQDQKKKNQQKESREQALKNLDAINGDEEKVLLKVNRKKGDQKKKSKTKDW
jgi:Ca-activated chloride channel family protein